MKSNVNLGFILSGALLISIPSFTQEKKEIKMETNQIQEKNKATIRKLYEDLLNTGKLELLNHVVADEYSGPRNEKGPEGLAQTIKPLISAFPDIKWTIEDLIAEGDKVVAKWSWKGTNKSSFNGFAPTNKEMVNNAIAIYQFDDNGKIIKVWMQSDRLGFLQQIGVVSPDILKPAKK